MGWTRRGVLGGAAAGAGGVALTLAGVKLGRPEALAEGTPALPTGRTRTYCLAAEEVDWDYAPDGRNDITGAPFDDVAKVFVENGPDRIGRVYRKSRYVAYTDGTFATPAPIPPAWRHLGLLGPLLRAEVGDDLVVVFRNNTRFPASVHAHGVLYDKDDEGAPYADGADAPHPGDAVQPGDTYTYRWRVPERAGPGPHDPGSVVWMYHSHVDEVADTNAGLFGPIVVTRSGMARADGGPVDVDRELVVLFSVLDENVSPYLADNVRRFAGDPGSVDTAAEEFGESNLMHAINGYVFGNLPGLTMRLGDRVRWYVLGLGTEVDLHSPHWHGQTLTMMGMRTDVAELLPGSMKTLDMVADAPGTWLLHCHVNDHIAAGMQALFRIEG